MAIFDFLASHIGSQIPLVVGCMFFALGFNMIFYFLNLRKNAKKVKGMIKAIEKYRESFGSGSDRTTNTYYRPIVEYNYNNDKHVITGSGSGKFSYKINQSMNVLLNTSKDGDVTHAVLDNYDHKIFGVGMIIGGLIAALLYIFSANGSALLTILLYSIITILGRIFLKNSSASFLNVHTNTWSPKEGSQIIETHRDYLKEVSSHVLIDSIFTVLGLVIGVILFYKGYIDLEKETKELIFSNISIIWQKTFYEALKESQKISLILCGSGLYLTLIALYSLISARKKNNAIFRT